MTMTSENNNIDKVGDTDKTDKADKAVTVLNTSGTALHPSHQAVMDAIKAYIAKYQISPAVRDIADTVHKAPNAVVASILALERAGYLTRLCRGGRRISRGILVHAQPTTSDAGDAHV